MVGTRKRKANGESTFKARGGCGREKGLPEKKLIVYSLALCARAHKHFPFPVHFLAPAMQAKPLA